jgi:large subunit ribosomal protein L13
VGAPGEARAARAGPLKTLIALPISPRRRSAGLRLRVLTDTLYYRHPGKRVPNSPAPVAAGGYGLVMWPRVLYTLAPFVGTYRPESFMQTVFAKPEETRGDWYVVDAEGKTLGRLASQIAHRLKGKHKPTYAPHQDLGDHIVVVNAGAVRVTGAKLTDKWYHQHTGYVGNLKSTTLEKLLKEHPERAIEFAVKGMLPKGPLGRRMYRKLHVFGGNTHPHQAQQPKALEL